MEFPQARAEALHDIRRYRRDVRHFRADPVAQPVLARLQATMDLAPSVGNSRPWRILQATNDGLRRRVQEIFETCNQAAAFVTAKAEYPGAIWARVQPFTSAI